MAKLDLDDLVYNLGFANEREFIAELDKIFTRAQGEAKKGGTEAGKKFDAGLNGGSSGKKFGDEFSGGLLGSLGKLSAGAFIGGVLANAFTGATQAVVQFAGDSIKEFTKFDAALTVVSQSGVANLEPVKAQIADLSKSIKVFSETDIASAVGQLVQGGLSIGDAMQVAAKGATLAAGSLDPVTGKFANVGTTSLGVANVIRALGLSFGETARVADVLALAAAKSGTNIEGMVGAGSELGGIAKTIGIPVEELAASIATLTNKGYSAQESATGLNTVIAALISPTGRLKEQADALGLSFVRADGTTRSLNEVMKNIGVIAERGGKGLQLLKDIGIDTYGLKTASALGQAARETQNFTDELGNATGASEKYAQSAGGSAAAQTAKFEASIKNAQLRLGKELMPAMTVFYEVIAPLLIKAVNLVALAFKGWALIFQTIADGLVSLGSSPDQIINVANKQLEALQKRESEVAATLARAKALAAEDPTNSGAVIGVQRLSATLQQIRDEIAKTKAEIEQTKIDAVTRVGNATGTATVKPPPVAPKPLPATPPTPAAPSSSALLAAQTEAQRKFNAALEAAVKLYQTGKVAALDSLVAQQRAIYQTALAAANAAKGDDAQKAAKEALRLATQNLEKAESAQARERDDRQKRITKAQEEAKKAAEELAKAIARVNVLAADQTGKDAAEKFTAAIVNSTDAKLENLRVSVAAEEAAARAALSAAVASAQAAKNTDQVGVALAAATVATNAISAAQGRYNEVIAEQATRVKAVFDAKLEAAKEDEKALLALVAATKAEVSEAAKRLQSSQNVKAATDAYKNSLERLKAAEEALIQVQRDARQAQLDLAAARRADQRELDIDNASLDQLRAAQQRAKDAVNNAKTADQLAAAKADLARIEDEIRQRLEVIDKQLADAADRAAAQITARSEEDLANSLLLSEAAANNLTGAGDQLSQLQALQSEVASAIKNITDDSVKAQLEALLARIEDRIKVLSSKPAELADAAGLAGTTVKPPELGNATGLSSEPPNGINDLTRVDTESLIDPAATVEAFRTMFKDGLLGAGKEALQELLDLLDEFLQTDLPASARASALALRTQINTSFVNFDSKPSDSGDKDQQAFIDKTASEFKQLGRGFVDDIIGGISSGNMEGAFKSILGNASSFFLNKIIDGILGDVATSLAKSVAASAGGAAGAAAGATGALGAFGPVGLAIGLGAGLLSLLYSQKPQLPNQGQGSSFSRDSSSPAISYTAIANLSFPSGASFEDPSFRAMFRAESRAVSLDLLRQLGLIDPAKAGDAV